MINKYHGCILYEPWDENDLFELIFNPDTGEYTRIWRSGFKGEVQYRNSDVEHLLRAKKWFIDKQYYLNAFERELNDTNR